MVSGDGRRAPSGIRREPPPFRVVAVRRVTEVTPFMARVTFGGPALAGLQIDEPAASVRLLLPPPRSSELVMPTWNGNEFLFDDGTRPIIRTFTPLDLDHELLEISLEVVLHEGGATSSWVESAGEGDLAAISGPGRGYTIDTTANTYVLAGDETALPAIGQLIDAMPDDMTVDVVVEVRHLDARVDLPERARQAVTWVGADEDAPPGAALVSAMERLEFGIATRIWAAGEAGAMQRIRRHLRDDRGLDRSHTTVRGYWKHGR